MFASQQQVDTEQATVDQLTAQVGGELATIICPDPGRLYDIRSPTAGKAGFHLVNPG
jgi:multidrug efflux system membrane fusion protein